LVTEEGTNYPTPLGVRNYPSAESWGAGRLIAGIPSALVRGEMPIHMPQILGLRAQIRERVKEKLPERVTLPTPERPKIPERPKLRERIALPTFPGVTLPTLPGVPTRPTMPVREAPPAPVGRGGIPGYARQILGFGRLRDRLRGRLPVLRPEISIHGDEETVAHSAQLTEHPIFPVFDRPHPVLDAVKARAPLVPRTKLIGVFGILDPAEWAAGANIASLPSVLGIIPGPERTMHPELHVEL
jgi:hypothetical protein